MIFCAVQMNSCDLIKDKKETKKNDTFYTDNGGFDRPRIPLIKPYELLKVSSDEWRMDLLTTDLLALSVHHVKGVHVTNERILLYSEGGTEIRNKPYSQAWIIIDPSLQKERAFFDHKKYADTLHSLGITDTSLGAPGNVDVPPPPLPEIKPA